MFQHCLCSYIFYLLTPLLYRNLVTKEIDVPVLSSLRAASQQLSLLRDRKVHVHVVYRILFLFTFIFLSCSTQSHCRIYFIYWIYVFIMDCFVENLIFVYFFTSLL